jgi:predicted AAA+ superfamily ATPase
MRQNSRMKRTYVFLLEEHLANHRQMAFLSGPRQVGKTTTSLEVSEKSPFHYYFNKKRIWNPLASARGGNVAYLIFL